MVAIVECERCCLINRHGSRISRGVRLLAGMKSAATKSVIMIFVFWHLSSSLPIQNYFNRLASLQQPKGLLVLFKRHLMRNQGREVELMFDQKALALIPGLVHETAVDAADDQCL